MESVRSIPKQQSLPGFFPIDAAVERLSESGGEERGAIFTRPEVVGFILDLIGYTADQPLHEARLLEPSFGEGDFLLIAADRLLRAYRSAEAASDPIEDLRGAVRGVELHRASFEHTQRALVDLLASHGLTADQSEALAEAWLVQGDFLLEPLRGGFTHVAGNPPYVRQELIPEALIAEYRKRYETIYDRADLYVPFLERSLTLLAEGGKAGIICSDRWMKNRYGGPLRRLVAEDYHLSVYIDMTGTDAFHSDVIAYPAITVIERVQADATRVAHRPDVAEPQLKALARQLLSRDTPPAGSPVTEVRGVAAGRDPWILEHFDRLGLMRRLERDFPLLEEAGCKVGIGVATGADAAFIAPYDALPVEEDRKLPLAMTRDIDAGEVRWRGLGVVNPFDDQGKLVPLSRYPLLAAYLEEHREQIAGRHVARKRPSAWYRTIDRITPELARTPKLLIPDIKGEAHIVYEPGELYPHHNLYYVTSESWDLRALQTVLASEVGRLFVALYSVKMRGGYLRFQAQYLRRIRLPHWKDVPGELRSALREAAVSGDVEAGRHAVFALYDLGDEAQSILLGTADAA